MHHRFLCQADHVSSLCIALQDELFETRETVLLTLSRLAPRNPAVVFPVLRGLMLRLLSELGTLASVQPLDSILTHIVADLTEDGRVREESARLVAHLMSCGPGLIRPYVASIVRVLLKRMPDNNTRVSSNCLVALGRTSCTCAQCVYACLFGGNADKRVQRWLSSAVLSCGRELTRCYRL